LRREARHSHLLHYRSATLEDYQAPDYYSGGRSGTHQIGLPGFPFRPIIILGAIRE